MGLARLSRGDRTSPADETILGAYTTIGRAPGNMIVLADHKVSRHHAVIRMWEDAGYVLSDLGSSNGTFLNGRRVFLPDKLKHKDVITIGNASLTFLHPESVKVVVPDDSTGDFTMMSDMPTAEPSVVGASMAMAKVFELMQKAAASFIPVLIQGETGTGKELVAHAIHHVSERSKGPFIPVNCAAMPETLLESQLFGHRKGSFTGADRDRPGLFESADAGTIFLDEVGEMPLAMQAKFLRVLQEGEVVPLGDTKPRIVNVRVISATNRDLLDEVRTRAFREDLYYRLRGFPIHLPPLRERREDVPLLVERFVAQAATKHRKRVRHIASDALASLQAYHWPGNVRELQNEILRAVAVAEEGDVISYRHLSPHIVGGDVPTLAIEEVAVTSIEVSQRPLGNIRDARAQFEASHISKVLEQEGGNVSRAATVLGLSRMALHRKIKEYGIR